MLKLAALFCLLALHFFLAYKKSSFVAEIFEVHIYSFSPHIGQKRPSDSSSGTLAKKQKRTPKRSSAAAKNEKNGTGTFLRGVMGKGVLSYKHV